METLFSRFPFLQEVNYVSIINCSYGCHHFGVCEFVCGHVIVMQSCDILCDVVEFVFVV